ncbi:MAG: hypothetical protein AB1521_02415 [Bacteroidota bacterium]
MTTLPPPAVKLFPDNSLEKKVYTIVQKFSDNIPIINDRNRLGYCLYKYMKGEGDKPEILVNSTKIKIAGITKEELAKKLNDELANINA